MTTQRYTITLSDGTTQVIVPALEVQSGSGALSTARQIQQVVPGTGGAGQFVLSGDVTYPTGSPAVGIRFQPGDTFEVSNYSDLQDPAIGTYTVASVAYLGSPSVTVITVNEDVNNYAGSPIIVGSPPVASLPYGQVRYATPGVGSPLTTKTTSLELAGRGVINYGEYLTANLLHLLENFGSITPPNHPTEGQAWFNSSDQTLNIWRSVGSPQWMPLISQEDAAGQFVDVAGDTMTGALILSGSPIVDLQATTKKYVDINLTAAITALGSPVLNNVVEDLTPQLGGNLDVNGFDIVTPNSALATTGSINITTGNGTGYEAGDITMTGGNSDYAGYAGGVRMYAGSNTYNGLGYGGSINIAAGSADAADGYGGDVTIVSGSGSGYNGGNINLQGGTAGAASGGFGGYINLKGGDGSNANVGGDVSLQGGISAGAGNGGGIFLEVGGSSAAGSPQGANGDVRIRTAAGVNSNVAPRLLIESWNSNSTVGLTVPTGPFTARDWTLPVDDPAVAAGGFLTTDASGVLSFVTPADSVAGLDTQVQFNDGGVLGASELFTFTKGTATLSLGGGSPPIAANIITPTASSGNGLGIDITAGAYGPGGNVGGKVHITGGDSNVVGTPSDSVALYGGANLSGSGGGGGVKVYGGDGPGGGGVYVGGGDSTGTGNGGSVRINGGVPGSSGNGGSILITAIAAATSGNGGDIKLRPGASTVSTKAGGVNVESYDVGVLGGEIRMMEKGNFRYIGLKSPDTVATTRSWELPQDDPAVVAGRALTTDASGVLSFTYLPGFERQAVGVGSPLVLPGSPATAPTVYTVANISWTVEGSPPAEPANKQSVQVFVDGVKQLVGIDYNVTDSTTITFIDGNEPAAASSHVEFISFG